MAFKPSFPKQPAFNLVGSLKGSRVAGGPTATPTGSSNRPPSNGTTPMPAGGREGTVSAPGPRFTSTKMPPTAPTRGGGPGGGAVSTYGSKTGSLNGAKMGGAGKFKYRSGGRPIRPAGGNGGSSLGPGSSGSMPTGTYSGS